ncbi:MAG TPA: hypothetical protein VIX73_24555 [Kofleriaceae bacterium]
MTNETVTVQLANGIDPDRIEVTCGIEEMAGRHAGYRPRAICPRVAWRTPTAGELAALTAPGLTGTTIAIAAAPASFMTKVRASGLVSGLGELAYEALVCGRAYTSALEAALPDLAPRLHSAEGLQVLGTSVQRGGLRSTTTHMDPGEPSRFSGLHVDNWDRLPLGQRASGRRQLCINLGFERRYFVFARTDVDTAVALLGETFTREACYIDLGRAWFARFPEAMLVRVAIAPGETYVAPTDNLIHDGSTSGTRSPDVTLNLRGRFAA